jgi:Flp pilus assembly protein TadD
MRTAAVIALSILISPPPFLPLNLNAATEGASARAQEDAGALAGRARRLQVEGHLAEALVRYERALKLNPDLFDAQLGIGIVLDLDGRYDEARTHLERAIELAPSGAKNQALTAMAVSYAFESDAKSAAKYLQQEYDRQQASGNLQGASETANALGRICLESGDPDGAETWYETGYETAKRQPNLTEAERDLAELRWDHARARIAARRGQAGEARLQVDAVKALIAKGDNPEQAVQLPYLEGYVAFYLENYREAAAQLERADQNDPFIEVLLAQAYEQLGEAARARQLYERVMNATGHSINNAFARPVARHKLGK